MNEITPTPSTGVPGHKLLFDPSEFRDRLGRLQSRLEAMELDVAIFDEIEAMTWIAGYGNSENRYRCCVVPVRGEPFFFIRTLDATPLRQRSWITDVVTFPDWQDSIPVLAEALRERGFGAACIGLNYGSYGTSIRRYLALQKALPEARLVDVGDVVAELRLIKSPAELALLRKASSVADIAMTRAIAAVRKDGTRRDVAAAAINAYLENGADPSPAGPITVGAGWDFLHGHLDDTPLAPGDVCHIELTPRINGYSARIMRCVTVGAASPEQKRITERLIAIQNAQIAAMTPGAVARDIDALARRPILEEGLRSSFDNITGYTLGLYGAAGPRTSDFTRTFDPAAEWVLEPGMVFHMYLAAGGLSMSETVLVGDDGPERLTSLERRLYEAT